MIGEITSLVTGHLGAGALLLVGLLALSNPLPEAFVRFCTASAAGLALVAFLLGSGSERLVWLGLAAPAGAFWLYVKQTGRTPPRFAAAIACGLATGVLIAHGALSSASITGTGTGAGTGAPLVAAASVTAALLLGASTVTMVLGHWYLVDTSLSIRPLRSGALWFWIAVAARWAAVAAALWLGGWETLGIRRAADIVFSTSALFFLFRSLMGLGAPLLLAALIWQTVRIRSTQSATGLLYVAVILVLFGELISQFLRVATGYPL